MAEKLCVFCKNLIYNPDAGNEYSEPANLECRKGHDLRKTLSDPGIFGPSQNIYDVEDFRQMIITAKDCHDYDEAEH